jgi:periplasmic copper chaperone A
MIRSYASTFAIIVSLLELLIPAVAVTAEYNVGSIAIMNPWSRATPKGSQTAIGYMTITNNGTASDRLIGGSIEIADMFQLHAMTIENDIAKMRDLRDIEIKPGETLEFKPGGSSRHVCQSQTSIEQGRPGSWDPDLRAGGHCVD